MNQHPKRSCTPVVQAVQVASVGANPTSVDISGQSAGSTAYFYVTAYNLTSNASSGWGCVVAMPTAATIAPRSNLVASASTDCHTAKSCAQNSMESRKCAMTLPKSSGARFCQWARATRRSLCGETFSAPLSRVRSKLNRRLSSEGSTRTDSRSGAESGF